MGAKPPPEIATTAAAKGQEKAETPPGKLLVAGFLAGAYIAFGGLVAVAVTAGMPSEIWGTLPTFFAGTVFALGLVLVVLAGSELLTGNMALVPLARITRKTNWRLAGRNLGFVLVGNLIGALFVAFFLAVQSGVLTGELTGARLGDIADGKTVEISAWQIFLRAVGCNWLVCLAVWLALGGESMSGKILGIFFPIMAFVAIGFDHVVANMFFLPAAMFADVGALGWGDVLENLFFAFWGNFVGGAVFVAGAYWFLYAREEEPESEPEPGSFDRDDAKRAQVAGGDGNGTGRDDAGRLQGGVVLDRPRQ